MSVVVGGNDDNLFVIMGTEPNSAPNSCGSVLSGVEDMGHGK